MENGYSDAGSSKNIVVMNVNEVEKVAATVDFVFSAVDMSKDEIKAIEEEYAKQKLRLFPTTALTAGHRMFRWLFRKSTLNTLT